VDDEPLHEGAMLRLTISALVASAAVVSWACSSTTPECRVGADCASGVCDSSGSCSPVSGGRGDGGGDARVGGPDGRTPGHEAAVGVDTGSPVQVGDSGVCVPDNNGVIEPSEYVMLAGLHANYEFADNVTVDTAGVANSDGSRTWDLTGPYAGDHTVFVTTNAPTGQWFSSNYPGATYTTPLSDTSNLLGIFQGTGSTLLLQGVASPGSGNGETELTYAPPADFITVPMKMGSTWTSKSNVTGLAEGLVANYVEQYTSKVDAYGSIKVPYGTFSVLEVQTTLVRTMLGVTTTVQSLSYVAECFGPVASATSQSNETDTHFTNAAEVRRLTP
jgi:hypothetical protein